MLSNFNLALAAAQHPFYLSRTFPGTGPTEAVPHLPLSPPTTNSNLPSSISTDVGLGTFIRLTVPPATNQYYLSPFQLCPLATQFRSLPGKAINDLLFILSEKFYDSTRKNMEQRELALVVNDK